MGWGVFLAGQLVGSLRRIKYKPLGALDRGPDHETLLRMEQKEQQQKLKKQKEKLEREQVKKNNQQTRVIRF